MISRTCRFHSSRSNPLHHKCARLVHSQVIIVGGGCAGMSVAAQLPKRGFCQPQDIIVFDPSPIHKYQPSYTMISGGLFGDDKSIDKAEGWLSHRDISTVFDSNVKLLPDSIESYEPDENAVVTASGKRYTYDWLVVAPGVELRFDMVDGLQEALDDPDHPCGSMYQWDYAKKINRFRGKMREGACIAVQPPMPIKCGGAPQKWVYLAEDSFQKNGVRKDIDFHFYTATPSIFPVKKYAEKLVQLLQEKNVTAHYNHSIKRVDSASKKAYFATPDDQEICVDYDLLHVPPPQRAPRSLATSQLADETGFMDLHPETMQSRAYPNVFGLGDSGNTPNAKTAAAIFVQAPIVVQNMSQMKAMRSHNLNGRYDGYGACPIFTGQNKLILAEFKYGAEPKETFSWDQSEANYTQYWIKRYAFPFTYWNLVPKGLWYGASLWRPPKFPDVVETQTEGEEQAK